MNSISDSEERTSRREAIVWRLYNEGWMAANIDLACRFLHPEIVWTAIEGAPDAGTYRGHEGARAYMQDWLDDFDFEFNEIEESIPIGDRLVCVQHGKGTGKGSGLTTDIRYACVYTFAPDELIVELNEYATKEEALEAAAKLA